MVIEKPIYRCMMNDLGLQDDVEKGKILGLESTNAVVEHQCAGGHP
jgi:hypothetical protein